MANHLARIFGTEEDRVNCPFYYKIGACRHGDRCSRTHQRPLFSATVMIPNMYQLPPAAPDGSIQHEQQHFEDFWEEIVDEFQKFGDVLECNVSTNMGDHLNGNVYIKFGDEDQAAKALSAINGRFYGGRTLKVEFSPVTNFREARCRAYDEGHCNRGGFCNFMHVRPVPKHLAKLLDGGHRRRSRSRSRSRSSSRDRRRRSRSSSRDRHRSSRRDGDRDRNEKRDGDRKDEQQDKEKRRDDRRDDRDRDRDRGRDRRDERRDDRRDDRDRRKDDRASGGGGGGNGGAGAGAGGDDREAIKRSSSEERRQMIASWNRAKQSASTSDSSSSSHPPSHST